MTQNVKHKDSEHMIFNKEQPQKDWNIVNRKPRLRLFPHACQAFKLKA